MRRQDARTRYLLGCVPERSQPLTFLFANRYLAAGFESLGAPRMILSLGRESSGHRIMGTHLTRPRLAGITFEIERDGSPVRATHDRALRGPEGGHLPFTDRVSNTGCPGE